jgi:hypothetical protein
MDRITVRLLNFVAAAISLWESAAAACRWSEYKVFDRTYSKTAASEAFSPRLLK